MSRRRIRRGGRVKRIFGRAPRCGSCGAPVRRREAQVQLRGLVFHARCTAYRSRQSGSGGRSASRSA